VPVLLTVDTTVGTVGSAALRGGLVDLDVADDKVVDVQVLNLKKISVLGPNNYLKAKP
jgi:hypothetical protein